MLKTGPASFTLNTFLVVFYFILSIWHVRDEM